MARMIGCWTIIVPALVATLAATSQAKPVISSTRYMETIYHDCPPTGDVQDCDLSFTKIPAKSVLTIQNVNCQISSSGGAFLMSASLKVSNEGIVGTQVAIPMVIVGSSQSNLTYAANQQIFAFAAAHYAPSIHTRWGAEVNADMTCTIAGQLETK